MPRLLSAAELVDHLASRSIHEANGCIRWDGSIRPDGYVEVRWHRKIYQVHRLAYELRCGPIPEGMTLDHVCHNRDQQCTGGPSCLHRSCFNPEHLEVVTGSVNSSRTYPARKMHCVHGHPYDRANTYRSSSGGRFCRACGRQRSAAYKIRKQMRAAGITEAAA